MRSKSILYGVNVPISPTSTSEATLTNNITISTNACYPGVDAPAKETVKNSDSPSGLRTESICVDNPYKDCAKPSGLEDNIQTRDIGVLDGESELREYLLKLYQTILLSDNKKLLTNAIFKDSIVLTQEDLEKVIEAKIGKKCLIVYEDPEIHCCGNNSPIMKISSIRINGSEPSDFKIKYNKEYLELITKYHLNLKYVLVN